MAAQLALDRRWTARPARGVGTPRGTRLLCAACQAREARYGFRPDDEHPELDRPSTLCFECFRLEIGRRQEAARVVQTWLPLEQTLEAADLRRRRAQIRARHALDLR